MIPIGQMMNMMKPIESAKITIEVPENDLKRVTEMYGATHTIEPLPFDNKYGRVDLTKLKKGESIVAGGKNYYYLLTKKRL